MNDLIIRTHFPLDIMLTCVQWYLEYALSLRNLEEMVEERGLSIDHSTIHLWVTKFAPVLKEALRKRKCGVGSVRKNWRMDETRIKIRGDDCYLYRAMDKGNTVDFFVTTTRNCDAARRFFTLAAMSNYIPRVTNIDKSSANKAGVEDYNNTVEQDYVGVEKRNQYSAKRNRKIEA